MGHMPYETPPRRYLVNTDGEFAYRSGPKHGCPQESGRIIADVQEAPSRGEERVVGQFDFRFPLTP